MHENCLHFFSVIDTGTKWLRERLLVKVPMVGYFAIISSAKLHKSRETGLELNLREGSRSD